VSALIHAATMVTAGVYMVVRTNAIYQLSPKAMGVVALVGAVTALFAASMGVVQNDIKKVLAYSTVSQLGYMFLACGVGAFTAGIFHLMTHAFFKGLLFLAAGSVIHAVSGEQDMRKMGALSKKIPITYWTMLIAALAIAGIFPFAGFISKDLILGKAYEKDALLWAIGYFTAGMTAFYMFRLIFMTFHGTSRVDHEAEHHIHESPKSMLVPLVILAALSIVGGWVSWPEIFGGNSHFINFLSTVVAVPHEARIEPLKGASSRLGEIHLMLLSEGLVVLGILFAWYLYVKRTDLPAKIAKALGGFYRLVYNKYYVDQLYDAMFVNRAKDLGLALGSFDRNVIDGVGVNGAGWLTRFISDVSIWWDTWIVDGSVRLFAYIVWCFNIPVRMIQDGLVQSYMLLIVLGLIGFFGYYFYVAHHAIR
jgi:NADH-quinone oxidoreductase subunit L